MIEDEKHICSYILLHCRLYGLGRKQSYSCVDELFTFDLVLNHSIPMGTNCAPIVADLCIFCFKRDFMTSLSDDNQTDILWRHSTHPLYI